MTASALPHPDPDAQDDRVQPVFTSRIERASARLHRVLGFNGRVQQQFNFLNRVGLRNRDFTIISDNCWAGFVYSHFALPYRTPFVGLFLFGACYIKLLRDFERTMRLDPEFIDPSTSRYATSMPEQGSVKTYPVGVIGDGIELHFLHYASESEALRKWRARRKRINPANILFKFCDRLVDDPALIGEFAALPFKNKICLTRVPYPYECVSSGRELNLKHLLNAMERDAVRRPAPHLSGSAS